MVLKWPSSVSLPILLPSLLSAKYENFRSFLDPPRPVENINRVVTSFISNRLQFICIRPAMLLIFLLSSVIYAGLFAAERSR